MRTVLLGAGLLALAASIAGCSLAPGGAQAERAVETVIDTGINDRRAYNDKKAEVLPALACDISVGAYGRMAESDVKRGVALICGLDRGQAVAADLNAAAAILDQLRSMNGRRHEGFAEGHPQSQSRQYPQERRPLEGTGTASV